MNLKLTSAIFLLLIFTLVGCKKRTPCEDSVTYEMPASFEQYHFTEGTYWVFADSSSGDLDSIYVTTSSFVPYQNICQTGPDNCNQHTNYFQTFISAIVSSSNGSMGEISIDDYGIGLQSNFIYDGSGNGLTGLRGFLMMFAGEPGDKRDRDFCKDDNASNTLFAAAYGTYDIDGNTFNNVRKFELSPREYSFLGQEVAYTIYWADAIGWVRMEQRTSNGDLLSTWNLQRWNIQL